MTDFSTITPEQWLTMPDEDIAALLQCNRWTVRRHRKKLGYPKVRKQGSGRPTKAQTRLFRASETNTWNAKKLGVTPQRAGQIRKQLNNEEWI